ncbi:MAG: glutamate-cysteine ligase family protein [Candidatus Woesearchaeota archaeon]
MTSLDLEKRMKKAFDEKSKKVLSRVVGSKESVPKVGIELELGVFDENAKPATRQDVKDRKIAKELGHHQIEVVTDPLLIRSLEGFKDSYLTDLGNTLSKIKQKVSSVGSIPNLNLKDFAITPNEDKYEKVPSFNNERVSKEFKTLFPELDARHVGLFNALQLNVDCKSVDDAVDKLNKSLSISPYLVAIFGNAKYINSKESGFKDCRVKVWEETHDTRNSVERNEDKETRIGLPKRYFSSIEDYFTRVSSHPFILDHEPAAFEIGIGLNWHDARIKFVEKSNGYLPLVEMRSLSSQQSAKEDVAATLMYIGLLEYESKLQSMENLRFNRESALKDGLEGVMIDEGGRFRSTLDVAKDKALNAREGLISLGYDARSVDDALRPVYRILDEGKSPADRYSVNEISQMVKDSFRN